MHEEGDLDFSGDGWILGDEADLAHHFQWVEYVDGAAGDGGTLRESVHGTCGSFNAQDRDSCVGH